MISIIKWFNNHLIFIPILLMIFAILSFLIPVGEELQTTSFGLLFFLYIVSCPIVGHRIAKRKNRDAFSWAVFCFWINIVGVIIIDFLPKLHNDQEPCAPD